MKRLSLLPIQYPDLFEQYKKLEAQTWIANSIDFSNDKYDSLTFNQKNYLKLLLGFFANSDKLVSDNIALNFLKSERFPLEAELFYGYQIYNENVHNETYGLIIENYIKNIEEKNNLFEAANKIEAVSQKIKWAEQWLDNKKSLEENLIAFACVELISFSSTFAGIFGFKSLGKQLPGLYLANEKIISDEASHGNFAIHVYNVYTSGNQKFLDKISNIKQIILSCCETELQFIQDCFEFDPEGFNKEDMINYVKYVTDTVLVAFGEDKHYHAKMNIINDQMKGIAIPVRQNFFEGRNGQYTKLTNSKIELDNDF